MRKKTLIFSLITLMIAVFGALHLVGQSTGNTAAAQQQQKLIRVATLNTVDANLNFQKNVQLIQQQRQLAIRLNEKIAQATGSEKQQLQGQLDALMAKLNENNKIMTDTYGFTLLRNYTMVVEKAHIYMYVTEEEAAAYAKSQQQNQ